MSGRNTPQLDKAMLVDWLVAPEAEPTILMGDQSEKELKFGTTRGPPVHAQAHPNYSSVRIPIFLPILVIVLFVTPIYGS